MTRIWEYVVHNAERLHIDNRNHTGTGLSVHPACIMDLLPRENLVLLDQYLSMSHTCLSSTGMSSNIFNSAFFIAT